MLGISKKLFLGFVFCFLLGTQMSYSGVPQIADSTVLHDTLQTEQDSVFALINQSFQNVKPMLVKSCYDCHSSQTKEPWYFNIPGINSFLTSHIKEAREHLDFTDGFPFKTKESLLGIMHEFKEEVEEGEMPLLSYRIMHWGRLIEGAQQDSLFLWIDNTIAILNDLQNAPLETNTDSESEDESED